MQSDASKKIALMYASDYGYGASKECTSNLSAYSESANCITTNNWLDKSYVTWSLSQALTNGYDVFFVDSAGCVDSYGYDINFKGNVHPTLTLASNVKISGGEGTSQKPYTLSVK